MNTPENHTPTPKIRSINGGEQYAEANADILQSTMSALGIPDETIGRTTVIIDGKSRLSIKGIAFPASLTWFTRRRYREHAESIDGPVIRLSTSMRGKRRSAAAINKTLVHELEHTAQNSRNDLRIKLGHFTIFGGMIAGAIAGNTLTHKNPFTRAMSVLAGAAIGKELGYRVAPHEKQARTRSTEIITDVIRTKALQPPH